MAVYAAYRHIELDNIGYGKKRVLKPPGGGTSDIFGTDAVESPRRTRTNHLQSSVFVGSAPSSETPARTKPGNNSHERLFGTAEARPLSACNYRLKSNINLGSDETGTISNKDVSVTAIKAQVRRNPVTGDGLVPRDCIIRRSAKKRDGNPVTGEGYAATNGDKEPSTMTNGTASATTNGTTNGNSSGPASSVNTVNSAPPLRNRVPPGGYSSGLW